MSPSRSSRWLFTLALAAPFLGGAGGALLGVCGTFTDVSDAAFCPFVLEIFTLGITTGTTPTTYDPSGNVTRLQMAAFLSRTVDRTLHRGSRRAGLNQFWPYRASLTTTTLGQTAVNFPTSVKSDGQDLWVSSTSPGTVQRVRGSDGRLLETWTGAIGAYDVLVAMGQVFITGVGTPGRLFWIDPSKTAGAVTTVASNLGNAPQALAFDGSRIWSANNGGASVSIVTPGTSIPWTVTTHTAGFTVPYGILYDGTNVWTTDYGFGNLQKLDASAAILQTVTVGVGPSFPVFDGSNIWVPNYGSASVSVVRASSGAVLATLTGNGLNQPLAAAFDGERVLVTNYAGDGVSLWKAADLTTIGAFTTGASSHPYGACSDGINFWIAVYFNGTLLRF